MCSNNKKTNIIACLALYGFVMTVALICQGQTSVFSYYYSLDSAATLAKQVTLASLQTLNATNAVALDNDDNRHDDPPPEALDRVAICAVKCKHIPAMCKGLYETTHWPAPECEYRSTNLKGDYYWNNNTLKKERDAKTIKLVEWAARQARLRFSTQAEPCEALAVRQPPPMMLPEEFELFVKTMARLQPQTYLEWGAGRSTSFYPLLASGQVHVIDNYVPWCETVAKNPVVQCLQQKHERLQFKCANPVHADGSPIVADILGSNGSRARSNC